jgi:hypothetical protein
MSHYREDRVTVEARQIRGKIEFSPIVIIFFPETKVKVLTRDEDQDRVWYPDFHTASRIAAAYEEGPGDDVRSARWDDMAGNWDVIEIAPSNRRSYEREDFHADG